jgi:hypothetical protein
MGLQDCISRVSLDICRKEADNVWTVPRYCDDTGKSDEQIVKVRKRYFGHYEFHGLEFG